MKPPVGLKTRYAQILKGRRALLVANERIREDMGGALIPRRKLFKTYDENARTLSCMTAILQELWREFGEDILPEEVV